MGGREGFLLEGWIRLAKYGLRSQERSLGCLFYKTPERGGGFSKLELRVVYDWKEGPVSGGKVRVLACRRKSCEAAIGLVGKVWAELHGSTFVRVA